MLEHVGVIACMEGMAVTQHKKDFREKKRDILPEAEKGMSSFYQDHLPPLLRIFICNKKKRPQLAAGVW
ncbi:hypothetical protein [uncultured Oxalicibacterium sp.]|uniref:hypothetical protein n=1 Tax=uncultured Oxalicibacterium sp. TaxID=1168540 RepID=UPI0025E4EF5F|nr:hypothetical protein [uncultured Oxalicibacterium sp.]